MKPSSKKEIPIYQHRSYQGRGRMLEHLSFDKRSETQIPHITILGPMNATAAGRECYLPDSDLYVTPDALIRLAKYERDPKTGLEIVPGVSEKKKLDEDHE